MRAHVSILGPVETHSKPFWLAIAFADDGAAVARGSGLELDQACEQIAFELRKRTWTRITCDNAAAPIGRKLGWIAGPRSPAAVEGAAFFAVVMAHGPDGNRLRPDIIAEVLAASVSFWERAPWRDWGEEPFEIEVEGEKTPRIAVCMGQAGTNFGVTLFDNARDHDTYLRYAMRGDAAGGMKVRQSWVAFEDAPAWAVQAVSALTGRPRFPIVGGAYKGRGMFPKTKDLAVLIATMNLLAQAKPGDGRGEVVQPIPGTETTLRVALQVPDNTGLPERDDVPSDGADGPFVVTAGGAAKKLNAKERKRLDAILAASRDDAPIRSLSALHGFFTAILSGPEAVGPDDWLPILFAGAQGAMNDLQDFADLAIRFHNEIAASLLSRGKFEALFDGGRRGVPADPTAWCAGYVRGMTIDGENTWVKNADPLTVAKLVTPILAFAGAKEQPRTPDIPSARARAAAMIGPAAQAAYDYWRERKHAG